MPEQLHNPRCFANHLGVYAVEPAWFGRAVSAIKAGTWPLRRRAEDAPSGEAPKPPPQFFDLTPAGLAVIQIRGALMKGWSKFADVDTLEVRAAVREATRDERAKAILLVLDSPGGSVPGIQELADDVAAADELKPVHAFIEDLGASAAYWVASQARRITVNAAGEVGSIGVLAVVADESEGMKMEGITVHVISTGAYKGAFYPGAPIPPAHLAYLQERVDATAEFFADYVGRGRDLKGEDLAKVMDGRVYGAKEAKRLGLVDRIGTFEETVQGLHDDIEAAEARARAARMRSKVNRARAGA